VGFGNVLREALAPLSKRIKVAFVFGFLDVNLMVIGTVGLRELGPALQQAQKRLGREINPVTISGEELADRVAHADRFVQTVLGGPKIFLIGEEDDLGRVAGKRLTA